MNKRRFRDTDTCKILILLLEIALITAFIYSVVWLYRSFGFADAFADEVWTYDGYVICMPDDYVNVRNSPNKNSSSIGILEPGDVVKLDGDEQNGYLHCVDLSFEQSDGWIHSGFVVYDRPEYKNERYTVIANKRLAARKYVNGRRTRWLKPMTVVTVYYWTPEWSVTNRGYVRSEYLEFGGE